MNHETINGETGMENLLRQLDEQVAALTDEALPEHFERELRQLMEGMSFEKFMSILVVISLTREKTKRAHETHF